MTDLATRNRANKRKGSEFERDLLWYWRYHGFNAEALRTTGRHDEGDLVLADHNVLFEAKAEKTISLSQYLREAEVERWNYAGRRGLASPPRGAAIVKRRGHGTGESYVVMTLDALRIDWL